jgi:SET domain-containing protein
MPPKNWPKNFTYSPSYVPKELHPFILKAILFNEKEKKSFQPLIEKKKIHPSIEIKKIKKPHPLFSKKTPKGDIQRGVFATKKILKNTFLGEYVGQMHLYPLSFKKKFNGAYAWIIVFKKTHYLVIDSQNIANELAFVNDYRQIAPTPNIKGKMVYHLGSLFFGYYTISDIHKNEELLVDYGKFYWK